MNRNLIAFALLLASIPARAFDVFACEPEWGALASQIAGEHATVSIATTAFQDPHSVQARPSLIAAARNADLLVQLFPALRRSDFFAASKIASQTLSSSANPRLERSRRLLRS